ncbi:MAG: response regulator transcription factor [Candidatus Saccharibacteria bacterium]|nr:response regulator transcription factor [Pseudorhodobacter sp.]
MSRKDAGIQTPQIKSALVIDDHPLYCDALAATLESLFNTRRIRTAMSLGDALQQLRTRFSPDLVVLDLNLPDVAGLSGFLKIKEKVAEVPLVVISATTSCEVIQSVMAAGASGFIPKDAGRETFKEGISAVWEGKTYVPSRYGGGTKTVTADPSVEAISRKIAHLSHQQSRILALICKGKPNKVIAYEMQLAEATVKAHITALLRRLEVRNRTQAAMMIREVSIRQSLK